MALSPAVPCSQKPIPQTILHSKQATLITNVSPLPSRKKNLVPIRGIGVLKEPVFGTCRSKRQCLVAKHRMPLSITALAADTDSADSPEVSTSDAIKKFYTCINDKNLGQIKDLISDNCVLEDSAFPYMIQGKREVVSFFSQLVESMGENARFRLGHVCQGEELTVSVDWHLEWEEDQIPFSRGCSIFQLANEEDKLVIRKAQIITESPIKPGKLVMAFLKVLTKLFDEFPKAAKWFLKSPQTIFKTVLTAFNLLMAPFVNPFLAFYINLWKIIVRILGYMISIVHFIAKLLNKKSSIGDQGIGGSKIE